MMTAETTLENKKTTKTNSLLTKNVIQFKNGFVNLPQTNLNPWDRNEIVVSVVAELLQFGFSLDKTAVDNLSKSSKEEIVKFHNEVITYLKDITGSNRNYTPFWKNFPTDVMSKSELELWIHQIFHYWSNGTYEPNEFTKARPTAFEQPKYTKITAGNDDKFLDIFKSLVSVNNSLTPDDLDIIKFFINNFELKFPDVIPFKENLTTIVSELFYSDRKLIEVKLPKFSVTDVLRIAVGMSGGDVSLPKVPYKLVRENAWSKHKIENPKREQFKFKKFKRSERKFILNLLEQTNCDVTEGVLKDQRWIRLGEIIHPTEYKKQFPKSALFFEQLRNTKVTSWYGKLNQAFKTTAGLDVLSERAGEFARRIDWLVRTYPNDVNTILNKFNSISSKVSNKVLFELYSHFAKRNVDTVGRSVMIKGSRKRTTLPELPALDNKIIDIIQEQIIKSLSDKFATLPKLGKVWINPDLDKIPLPSNMRSASSGLRPVIRGQRTPIGNENTKTIRAFVHWFDEHGSRDLDLTAILIGMGKSIHIGWNGAHNAENISAYSGDVRHRQGPCAEYIDIDIKGALKQGFKYAIVNVCNYNGGSLQEITDCVTGFMEREFIHANEVFLPKTLSNTFKLTSESSQTIIGIIDLETKEYIHLDIDQNGIPVASANFNDILEAIKPYCEKPKFGVYDLVKLHAQSRGTIVSNKEESDTKFEFDDFVNSYVKVLELMGI